MKHNNNEKTSTLGENMTKKSLMLVVALSALFSIPAAQAVLLEGTFSGSVYGGSGITNGVDLSTLNGSSINGSFSFDTATLTPSNMFANASGWSGSATNPISITENVNGNVFTFLGLVPISMVSVQDNNSGTNSFSIQASSTSGVFGNVGLGNSSDGLRYISNLNDPATIGFNSTTPGNIVYSSVSNLSPTAAFYFNVTSASVSPAPEPESYAMMLAGLGLIGFIARRTNRASKRSFDSRVIHNEGGGSPLISN